MLDLALTKKVKLPGPAHPDSRLPHWIVRRVKAGGAKKVDALARLALIDDVNSLARGVGLLALDCQIMLMEMDLKKLIEDEREDRERIVLRFRRTN
jgi:hypothetical protein